MSFTHTTAATLKGVLPEFRSHKRVHASIIKHVALVEFGRRIELELAHAKVSLPAEWGHKHQPEPGGYLVVYEDGYTSFSPAAAFEGGYSRIEGGE